MEDNKEVDECIALEEIPRSNSPASAPSPSVTCQSAVTEDAELDHGLLTEEDPSKANNDDEAINEAKGGRDSPNLGRESPSINLSQELKASNANNSADENDSKSPAQPRIIAVTPQPGTSSPGIKGDHDSGVKSGNEDDNSNDDITPAKRAATPSLASSEADSVGDGGAQTEEPVKPAARKGGSSQPPKFKNNVEPMEYHRPAAPAYNRAVHSVQCKAMLIIMAASILAVALVVGFIILNSGKDEPKPTTTAVILDGSFNVTNRPYMEAFADTNSTEYRQLSREFTDTMNTTFRSSESYEDFYETTVVSGIERSNSSGSDTARPLVEFTVNLAIPKANLTTDTANDTQTSDPASDDVPPIIGDIISYLVDVTASGGFGNFTGQMTLVSVE